MEMIHAICLPIIALLVATGVYLIWELKKELSHQKEMLSIAERIGRSRKDRVSELEAIKLETQQALDKIRSRYSDLYIDYESASHKVARLEKETEQLKARIEQMENHIKFLESDRDSQMDNLDDLKSKLQSAYGRIGSLTRQLSGLKKDEPAPVKDEVPPHLFTEFPQEIRQLAWEEMKRLEPDDSEKAKSGVGFCLGQAFVWEDSEQGYMFWRRLIGWEVGGASLNHTPPNRP